MAQDAGGGGFGGPSRAHARTGPLGLPTAFWAAGAAVLVAVLVLGVALVLHGSSDDTNVTADSTLPQQTFEPAPLPSTGTTSPSASPTTSASATGSARPKPTATTATGTVPATKASAGRPRSGGLPDAASTGVRPGTRLSTYTGPLTITRANTVIEAQRITGCVVIRANNVTIRNSLIQSRGCFFNVLNDAGNTNLVLSDVEIDGEGNTSGDSAVGGENYTCLRCNLHNTVDGAKAGSNVVVRDSYIHDLAMTADSHNDGIQSLGTSNLRIEGNTIVVKDGGTSAIILSTGSASSMRNITIAGNLLGGGAYTVYGGYQSGSDDRSKVSNISITDNRFTTRVFPKGGAFGPLTSADSPVKVSGNTWADGPLAGKPVT